MREIQPIPSDLGHAGQRYILLRKGQKKPLEKGWQEKAYSRHDPAIEAHIAGGGNIGMLCGQGLIVVDLDNHDPSSSGAASWAEWCAQNGDDPAAYRPATVSPSGGQHIYFSVPPDSKIQNRVGVRPGVDIKSDGGYVVVPPSRISTGAYIDAGGPVYEAPAWLIEEISAKQSEVEAEASEADVLDDGVALSSATSENQQVSRLEAFTVDGVLDKLARLYRDREYWWDVWTDRLLPDGKSPSQRDIHTAYWLFRAGYSYEETEAIMTACPAVAERPIHAGRQQKPWGRESYRRATLTKARKLALRHAALIASSAGNKSEISAVLEKDEVYESLTGLAKIRKYAVDARVALKVREVQLKSGRAEENKPVTVSWGMMQIPESSLLRHKPAENRFLEVVSISRQRGRASAYRLRLDAIQESLQHHHLRVYNTYHNVPTWVPTCQPSGTQPDHNAGAQQGAEKGITQSPLRVYNTYHNVPTSGTQSRAKAILDLLSRGKSYSEISASLGVPREYIKKVAYRQRQKQAKSQPQPQPEKEIKARSIDIHDPNSPFILIPYQKEANKLADTIAATLSNLGHNLSDSSRYKIRDAILKAAQSLALDYSISPDHDWLEYADKTVTSWLTHRQSKHRPSNDSIIHKMEDILGYLVYCSIMDSDKQLSDEFNKFYIQLLSSLPNRYAHIPNGRAMLRFSQARKYQFQRYLERKIRQTIALAIAA